MNKRLLTTVPALTLATLLAACSGFKSVDKAPQQAQLNLPEQFNLVAGVHSQQPVAAWWAQLQDETLKQLVGDALARNHDIRIAQASLAEARALLRNSQLNHLPTVQAKVAGQREKTSEDLLAPNAETISETFQAGFDASWEADLFGRVRNQVRLSKAQLAAREADLRAAHVSVAAEVAATYINLRGQQYLLQVAEDSARIQGESLALTQRFAEVGRGDELDSARAEAQLELTRAAIPSLQAHIDLSINRLAVLSGEAPETLQARLATPQPLPSLPTTLAVGDPVSLLQRRPDIQAAEQALKGAVAEYNVRVADLYPRISLDGSLGYLSTDWSRLGEEPTETFVFAPTIRWAAFDLGRVQAQINAADARAQARLAQFEQSVQRALEETDNALQNFSREEERRATLQQAARASSQAARFARQKFEIGSGDFYSVLDAERSQLDINAQLAQSETQLLLNLIAIYKALGGGWETHAGNAQLSLSF
jgi:efflux transporter, outer membrane factor (OMF) lipoprotein, NodT family